MRDRLLPGALLVLAAMLSSCVSHQTGSYATIPSVTKKQRKPQPATVLAMERQIKNAIDAGEGDPFVRSLRQRVSQDPDNLPARLELAGRYESQGAPELAIDHLRIAITRHPDSEPAALQLARALARNEQPIDAIAALALFCEAHTNASSSILEEAAMLEDEAGAFGEGERYHRRAISVNAANDVLRNNLGQNFMQQGKHEDAAHEFKAALSLNPRSEAARNNLGFALVYLHQNQEALLHWQSLSGPAAAHNNLAVALIEQGQYPEARKEIEIALDYDRQNPAALRNLQLLSDLDGKSASFTIKRMDEQKATSWNRLASMVTKVFRGEPKSSSASKVADAASVAAGAKSTNNELRNTHQ